MKVIGITGGIGSGKSLVADIMVKNIKHIILIQIKLQKSRCCPRVLVILG